MGTRFGAAASVEAFIDVERLMRGALWHVFNCAASVVGAAVSPAEFSKLNSTRCRRVAVV